MLSATAYVITEAPQASAQDAPPSLRMLLNLDLFSSRQTDASATPGPGGAASDSMLDQIRALDALGYLGNPPDATASDAASQSSVRPSVEPPEAPEPTPAPPGNPDFDAEGPQR